MSSRGPPGAPIYDRLERIDGVSGTGYATVAYIASTGASRWVSRYNGHGKGADDVAGLAVDLVDSGQVYVTGTSQSAATGKDTIGTGN